MIRIYPVLLLVVSAAFHAGAQQSPLSDTINWRPGKVLSWDDFKAEPVEGIGVSGEVFCQTLANFEKPSAFQRTKFVVVSYFDQRKSWALTQARTELLLSYFQVIFDLYGLHALKLRHELKTSKWSGNPSAQFQTHYSASMNRLMDDLNAFRRESKAGTDAQVVSLWREKITREVTSLEISTR